MRVLTVCANLLPVPFDYAAWSTRRLSRALQAQGAEPILFTGSFSRRLSPGRIKRVQIGGIDCLAVGMRGTASRDGLSNPSAAQAFEDALHALRPDVVHINSVSGLGFDLVAAATHSAVPTVVTVRDASYFCQYGTMVPPGGDWCGTPLGKESPCWECLRGTATQRQRNAYELLDRADIVLSSSPYLAAVLRQWGLEVGVHPDGCWPGPNPDSKPPRTGSARMGFMWGFTAADGAEDLLRALHAARRSDYEFHLAVRKGVVDERHVRAVWRIPGLVRIVPCATETDLRTFLNGIDALLLPQASPGLPAFLAREAARRSVLTLTADNPDLAESTRRSPATLVLPADKEQWGRAIAEFLENTPTIDGAELAVNSLRTIEDQARDLLHSFQALRSSAC